MKIFNRVALYVSVCSLTMLAVDCRISSLSFFMYIYWARLRIASYKEIDQISGIDCIFCIGIK